MKILIPFFSLAIVSSVGFAANSTDLVSQWPDLTDRILAKYPSMGAGLASCDDSRIVKMAEEETSGFKVRCQMAGSPEKSVVLVNPTEWSGMLWWRKPKMEVISLSSEGEAPGVSTAAAEKNTNATSTAEESHRAMNEMHGGCDHFKMDVKSALKNWNEPVPAVAENGDSPLPLSKKLELFLKKQSDVKFIAPPGKTFGDVSKAYAGVFKFTSSSDSRLQIAASAKVWFDVVDEISKENVKAKEFEMQTACNTIFKVVAFELKSNKSYTLQVSSSLKPQVEFLLNPVSH